MCRNQLTKGIEAWRSSRYAQDVEIPL